MEYAQLQDKTQKHEFQAMMGGWGTGTDPDTSDNLWVTDEGRNFVQYSNPEVDRLYKAGAREFDRAKRAEIYGQIARILYEDQPYTWLYYRSSFYGFNKQLRGYTFSPRGVFGHAAGMSALWKAAE
jgi:peptide/nickel transport system substrate-binding protein